MDSYLARQPIFDDENKVCAYEILYRSSLENYFSNDIDSVKASSRVIFDTFQSFGLDNLTGQKPAFINFSTELLKTEIATLFPKDYLVVEILEDVEATPEIVGECRNLKKLGYTLALDDFVYRPALEPLLDLADIIKIDFLATNQEQFSQLREKIGRRKVKLLAEKIETWDDFHRAEKLGFELFQGYFFSKPEVLSTAKLTPLEISYTTLLQEVNGKADLDYNALANIIEGDVFLAYTLLKLVNSAYFGTRQEITSIKQALVFLGEQEIKKWVTLISMRGMNHTFEESVSLSIIRAEFARQLGEQTGFTANLEGLFLACLFSLLDVLLQRPLDSILEELRVPEEVGEVLLFGTGPYGDIYNLILAYEQAEWTKIRNYATNLQLDSKEITNAYLEAIKAHPNIALVS